MAIFFKTESTEKSIVIRVLFSILALIALASVIIGAVLLTEAGQMINVPRDWLVSFFYYHKQISICVGVILSILVVLQIIYRLAKKWIAVAYPLTILACLFLINSFVPDYWLRSQQYTAQYTSIDIADKLLADDDDVFVLDINGVTRAYPKSWMHLPHFAGDNFAGEEATVAYCVLSNLPLAFSSSIEGEPTDFKVIAQAHNNLIFTDRKSGELVQQVTGIAEYSKKELKQHPIQRMPWRSFRELYPSGKVFRDVEPNILDKITTFMFARELVKHYNGDPIFPTLRLDDNRLTNAEQIFGIRIGEEQLAVTKSYLESSSITNTEIGGQKIVIAWFAEYETLGVFLREIDGKSFEVTEIDPYGTTPQGKLRRIQISPGVFWMVWSHWFPNTKVLN